MPAMIVTVGREYLLLLPLLCVAVLGDSQKTVFSIQVASPSRADVINVSFSRDTFERFYNCLSSSATCTVSYIETHSTKHLNNVVHVRGRYEQKHPPSNRGKSASTSYCARTRTGTLKCRNKSPTDDLHGFGVRPLWKCDRGFCPCVYIYNVRQISHDNSRIQECIRTSPVGITSRLLRARRAAPLKLPSSSSRSSYSRSSSPYRRPGSPSISPGSPPISPGSSSRSQGSSSRSQGTPYRSPGSPVGSPGSPVGSPGSPVGSPGSLFGSPGSISSSPGSPSGSPGSPSRSPGSPHRRPRSPRRSLGSRQRSSWSPSSNSGNKPPRYNSYGSSESLNSGPNSPSGRPGSPSSNSGSRIGTYSSDSSSSNTSENKNDTMTLGIIFGSVGLFAVLLCIYEYRARCFGTKPHNTPNHTTHQTTPHTKPHHTPNDTTHHNTSHTKSHHTPNHTTH